jgi:hypothetical protein
MAVREHVAAYATNHRVVTRDRAVGRNAQNLALVGRPVLRRDVRGGRQILGVVDVAAVRAEVRALVAQTQIEHAVWAELQAACQVIVAHGKAREDVVR